MANIKISEAINPDLVDVNDVTDLGESETKSINGGDCSYRGKDYSPGSIIRQLDGRLYKCKDVWFRGDKWVKV